MRQTFARGAPRYQLLVLLLFGLTYCVNILNWVMYVYYRKDEIGDAVTSAYLAFSIIGWVMFFFFASPFIYWPYICAGEMAPKARRNAACLGVTLCFLLHDFPMEWIEIYLVRYHGWGYVFSSISLFLVNMCFAIGFFTTWISYNWLISKRLQLYCSGTLLTTPPSGYMPPSSEYYMPSSRT
ncbi:hypothetical protein DQ04_00431110 [Trypanosoma grayi]|uniref:hypothetical protein n=1 Tax=Trypanosoma grayi TaxID=71804 RepID=UPI0004F48D1B|nr:hypothetical protein DQ04_00431110 [Trypanosoma grayi]KEG14507.1 hypothetical protein DQ04_00431110 [Trypanosoma grayi]